MSSLVSQNTQAILLLTAPLIVGRGKGTAELLTLSEYNRLARLLREKQRQPADLLAQGAEELIESCASVFGRERLESLLGRGFLLSQAVEKWSARAIWVVSRADAAYPRRIKARLKEDAPPLLYGCGDAALLDRGGFAVVGSRHVDDELISYTEEVGRLAARAHHTLISGAAKGIDRAAMHGALQSGGLAAGVMSDSLERGAVARENREFLMDNRLVLISPYDPAAGFNVGHAMQRNKIIYALADAALVVNSDFEKGGTWAGAIEQIEKLRFVPVFVRNGTNAGKGNSALLQHGGIDWPNPRDEDHFVEALNSAAAAVASKPKQASLSFSLREEAPLNQDSASVHESELQVSGPESSPAEALFSKVTDLLALSLTQPKSETEIAELLGVSKAQAKDWLKRLVATGVLEKASKPVRYVAATGGRLF